MLVLSRRLDEEIVIDGQIRIKVLTNSRGRVRLGITAPEHIRIERSERALPRTIECLAPLKDNGTPSAASILGFGVAEYATSDNGAGYGNRHPKTKP